MINAAPEGAGLLFGAGICGAVRVRLFVRDDVSGGKVDCGVPVMSSVR